MTATVTLTGGQYEVPANAEYVLSPHTALVVTSGGSGFVLDMSNDFMAISAIGAELVQAALTTSRDDAIASIAQRYGAEPATVGADLDRLFADLSRRGIIQPARHSFAAIERSTLAAAIAWLARALMPIARTAAMRATISLLLARISFSWCGWVPTVVAWRQLSLRSLPPSADTLAQIDDTVRRVSARLPFLGDCKERALTCWLLSRQAGADAKIVIGMNPYPLSAHAWCEVGSDVFGDEPEVRQRFVPVFRYS